MYQQAHAQSQPTPDCEPRRRECPSIRPCTEQPRHCVQEPGEGEKNSTARLEAAVTAYQEALKQYTRERMPPDVLKPVRSEHVIDVCAPWYIGGEPP